MSTLAEADFRIAEAEEIVSAAEAAGSELEGLHGQLQQLKVRRNAMTPLCRLFPELLVAIVKELIFGAKYHSYGLQDIEQFHFSRPILFRVLAVSTQLRETMLRAAELWARIDFAWPLLRLNLFIMRARGYPLHAHISTPHCVHFDIAMETLLHYLSRVQHLHLNLPNEDAFAKLQRTSLHDLRSLSLQYAFQAMDADFVNTSACVNLVSLRLSQLHIQQFPLVPVLQHLVLRDAQVEIRHLQVFLQRTPRLVTLTVDGLGRDLGDDSISHVGHVDLPHLQRVYIAEDRAAVAQIIEVLPLPSAGMVVSVYEPRGPSAENEATREHWSIASRFHELRTQLLPDMEVLCTIAVAAPTDNHQAGYRWRSALIKFQQEFGATDRHLGHSELWYQDPGHQLSPADPILRIAQRVSFDCRASDGNNQRDGWHNILQLDVYGTECFPALETVRIHSAHFDSTSGRIKELEAWLLTLQRHGRLTAVEFWDCRDLCGMYVRLEEKGAVGIVERTAQRDEDAKVWEHDTVLGRRSELVTRRYR
jgi:hypothetical protein